jgi:hypothetical protein
MASREELINQRKLLQRKVSSGTATSADRERLKAVQIQIGKQSASAGVDRGPYASYTKEQRATLNKELPKSTKTVEPITRPKAATPQQISAAARKRRLDRRVPSPGRNPSEAEFGAPKRSKPIGPGRNPSEAEFGAPKRSKPIGPGRNPSEAEFGAPKRSKPIGPGRNPTEAEFGAPRKTAAKHILNDDPKLAQANEFEGVKTKKKGFSLSDLFDSSKYKKTSGPDDYSPAKRTYDTPFGEIDLDTSEEGMFGDSELYDMGQKKGGRLKKAAGKKAVAKKAVTKKPVAKKKAVKKNTVRKRAALRGHRAELRGG